MSECREHSGPIAHEAAKPGLHEVKGTDRILNLARPAFGQFGLIFPPPRPFRGNRKSPHRPNDADRGDGRHQADKDRGDGKRRDGW